MSNVMLTYSNGLYNHLNKGYMALLMGSLMAVIHFIIMIWQGYSVQKNWIGLIISIIMSLIFIMLIRKQAWIDDKQFLKSMIEHHDMALLMSEKIKEKTNSEELKNFADHIIRTQQNEINYMRMYLDYRL